MYEEPEIGKKYKKLTVLGFEPRIQFKNGKTSTLKAICECECGVVKSVNAWYLVRGKVGSCGCAQRAKFKDKVERIGNCKYFWSGCQDSKLGLCCWDCDKHDECDNACLNTKDKCGCEEGELNAEIQEGTSEREGTVASD